MKYISKSLLAGLLGVLILTSTIATVNATGNTERKRNDDRPSSMATASSAVKQKNELDIACVQTAVEKRETAVAAAVDTYYNALKTALSTRKTELHTAWAITDNKTRSTAVRAAWKTFETSRKAAQKTYRESRLAAWKTFTTDRRVCNLSNSLEENVGRGNDLNM